MNYDGKVLLQSIGGLLTHTAIPHYEFTKEEMSEIDIVFEKLCIMISEYEGKSGFKWVIEDDES